MTLHPISRSRRATFGALAMLVCAMSAPGAAQAPQTRPALKTPVPLKVDVVLSRFLNDKKVSSAPFTLWVSAVDPFQRPDWVSIRMGIDVPIGSRTESVPNRASGTTTTTTERPEYRYIGTSIDCRATLEDDGRFAVEVQVQDSSIYSGTGDDKAAMKAGDPLAFKSFTMNNKLSVRPGQAVEYSTATDRLTGEVVKVEVTTTVVK